MPKLSGGAPVLLVSDVVAAANYFRDACGFVYEGFFGDPPSFCICCRDRQFLMLALAPDPSKIVPLWKVADGMWDAYFWVDDADALYAKMKANGARMDYGPATKPYGVREFGIQDLDGHDIGFGQVLETRHGAPAWP